MAKNLLLYATIKCYGRFLSVKVIYWPFSADLCETVLQINEEEEISFNLILSSSHIWMNLFH